MWTKALHVYHGIHLFLSHREAGSTRGSGNTTKGENSAEAEVPYSSVRSAEVSTPAIIAPFLTVSCHKHY